MAAQGDHLDCARLLLYHKANVDEVTVVCISVLAMCCRWMHESGSRWEDLTPRRTLFRGITCSKALLTAASGTG